MIVEADAQVPLPASSQLPLPASSQLPSQPAAAAALDGRPLMPLPPAQTSDGAWLRLAQREYCYGRSHGASGWILIDASDLGHGVLFEPVDESAGRPLPPHTLPHTPPHAPPHTPPPPPAAAPATLSVEEALRRAGLPVEEYLERLTSVGIASGQSFGSNDAQDITDAAKRAKLPLGHRLKIAGVFVALGCKGA